MSVDVLVQETLSSAQHLHKTLLREQQILQQGQTSDLQEILDKKQEQVLKFQDDWDQLLQAAQVDPKEGIYEQILRYCKDPVDLDRLIDMTKKCQYANQVNGTVVNYSLRRAKTTLDILLGRESHSYSADGQAEGNYTTNKSRKA